MRIGCLQFAPHVGDLDSNLNRADAVLNRADPRDLEDLDILVLPEMAFTGYNFKSLREIMPFLEPAGSGISALWARTTALKYDCKVAVGYPEKVDASDDWPSSPKYYNSLLLVNEDGETLANYRKQHLYYTDESWSLEGSGGFFQGEIDGLGHTAMGICMDINPYKFEAPWHQFEFAFHVLESNANVVIVSMAWSTLDGREAFCSRPYEPDMATLEYWAQRMEPLIRAEREDEIILIFANRCGIETDSLYAGTSAVLGIQDGEVKVYGVLGRGVKQLLVVDTDDGPFAKLVSRPGRATDQTTDQASTEEQDEPMAEDMLTAEDSRSVPPTPVIRAPVMGTQAPVKNASEGAPANTAAPSSAVDISTDDPSTPKKVLDVDNSPKQSPRESLKSPSDEGLPRADSPILSPSRPQLTISTNMTPSPTRLPPQIGVTSAGTLTPPPTGDFPEAFYQEAARQDQLQSAVAPNLYTPEEPLWPGREMPESRPSSVPREQQEVRPSPPRVLPDALPRVPSPIEVEMGDAQLKAESPADVLPASSKENQTALLAQKIPLPEEVPLPPDSSSECSLASDAEDAGDPLTAIPPQSAGTGEEYPIILFKDAEAARRESALSEASISIGVEGGKEIVVVQLRDPSAPPNHPTQPRLFTVTFSI